MSGGSRPHPDPVPGRRAQEKDALYAGRYDGLPALLLYQHLLTARKAGKATITLKIGNKTFKCKVTVK